MAEIGYFLSSEEHGPLDLLEGAKKAQECGFGSVFISDHYHPWIDAQGESPFVWSVIGGIATATSLRVMTGVTCPTYRIHPAVLAQATATAQLMTKGKFAFGVGSGENLNEHILGDHWPPAEVRLERLEEAVKLIRELWSGRNVTHYGKHFTVENARIYSAPGTPPPILVSAFGEKALEVAARIGDGFVTTSPSRESIEDYKSKGGAGPTVAAVKLCWHEDESQARKLAYELWPTTCVPGQLNQELPSPAMFEEAVENVTEDMVAEKIVCGPDPERHAASVREYLEAGFDEVYVTQIGPDQAGFLDFFTSEVRPRL